MKKTVVFGIVMTAFVIISRVFWTLVLSNVAEDLVKNNAVNYYNNYYEEVYNSDSDSLSVVEEDSNYDWEEVLSAKFVDK